jgi:hypothetical protein
MALRRSEMGSPPSGRKRAKAGKKKALKCAFRAGEFFTASVEIFVVLDDQDRSNG